MATVRLIVVVEFIQIIKIIQLFKIGVKLEDPVLLKLKRRRTPA